MSERECMCVPSALSVCVRVCPVSMCFRVHVCVPCPCASVYMCVRVHVRPCAYVRVHVCVPCPWASVCTCVRVRASVPLFTTGARRSSVVYQTTNCRLETVNPW